MAWAVALAMLTESFEGTKLRFTNLSGCGLIILHSRACIEVNSDVVLFPVSVFRFRCSRFQRFPVAHLRLVVNIWCITDKHVHVHVYLYHTKLHADVHLNLHGMVSCTLVEVYCTLEKLTQFFFQERGLV